MESRSSQISDAEVLGRRAPSDECAGMGGSGSFSPRQVGYSMFGRIDWARPLGFGLYCIMEAEAERAMYGLGVP